MPVDETSTPSDQMHDLNATAADISWTEQNCSDEPEANVTSGVSLTSFPACR